MAAGAALVMVWVSLVYVLLLVIKIWLAIRVAQRQRITSNHAVVDYGDVAVAQAILSGDPALASALEDNLHALARAHFIWVVDEDDSAGLEITRSIQQHHPHVRIDIVVVPPPADSVNPKLFKLARARPLVNERVIVVLDDDSRLPKKTMTELVRLLDGAMLSTALPGYLDASTWPSRWLAAFVNNNAALTYLPMLTVWPALSINGMAYALETVALDQLGGFDGMTAAVTDDLAIAGRVIAAGGTISQSPEPVWVQTTVGSARQYVRVMHRWYVFALILIANQAVSRRLVIAGAYGIPPLLLWAVIVMAAANPSAVSGIVIAALLVARSLGHLVLQRCIYERTLHRPVVSIVSELMQPLHLAHALMHRTIAWRTRRYHVNLDQTFRKA